MERFEQLAAALRQSCPALELREHEPMARHTTFRIGGPVRLMAMPRSEGEVLACLREAERAQVRLVVLGNGSNLLAVTLRELCVSLPWSLPMASLVPWGAAC